MSGWRVVLVGGETLAIEIGTDSERYDPRTVYRASHDRWGSCSYDGYHAAVMALAHSRKWAVREVVPPGELTTAESLAAERQRVADVLAKVERELKKRATECEALADGYAERDNCYRGEFAAHGKSLAYAHSAAIVRAEFATIGGNGG